MTIKTTLIKKIGRKIFQTLLNTINKLSATVSYINYHKELLNTEA